MTENQSTTRSKKSLRERWLHRFSQGLSRQSKSSRAPSPDPSRGKVDYANVEPGGEEDAELGATVDCSQDQESENNHGETNTGAANWAQEDMWKIAEVELRRDRTKKKLLDAYYDILKSKLKEDLEPAGTPERQKQLSVFILSESKSFRDPDKSAKFASVLMKAANCILKAEKVFSAASQPFLPASIACAGVMLILSVSSSLTTYA
jgi:hypothetical protein